MEYRCSSRGLVGRLVVFRREGDGASAKSEPWLHRLRFGERYLVGESLSCIVSWGSGMAVDVDVVMTGVQEDRGLSITFL